MKKKWVMFGHNHFFGDFLDIIANTGGVLTKVVQNVPEEKFPGRPTLEERIKRVPLLERTIEIIQLKNFMPEEEEHYLVGFSLKKMEPLVRDLKERFGLRFSTLVHRTAISQMGALLADGVVVDAGAVIGPWARVEEHAVVGRMANVGHDCVVGKYSWIAASAVLCGHSRLEEDVFVGANATILPDVRVGEGSIVAAGAVVTKDVPERVMVAGVPAVIKKKKD